jgi:peptidoglycan/xylan/chitin deacetylase (PgdA/CDA1 family)
VVPVLVYDGVARERSGRLTVAARSFEQQMQYLRAEGYRPVSLKEFLEFTDGRRQLPMKSVLLTFDGGNKSFLRFVRPVLKDLKYPATLFVPLDAVGGTDTMTWPELNALLGEGFDVQAYSKTRTELKRHPGESAAQYDARMEAELGVPGIRFRQYFARASETLAYPLGAAPDDELARQVRKYGYQAGFTIGRDGNPAFVPPLAIGRTQVRADMTMAEFAQSLVVFRKEPVAGVMAAAADHSASPAATASDAASPRRRMIALHSTRAEELEREGSLRQALDERTIAAAFDPGDEQAKAAVRRLEATIGEASAKLLSEARRLQAGGNGGAARQHFLALLAVDPANRVAFDSLRERMRDVTFLVHTVKEGDTLADLAHLYYGDARRSDAIATANALPSGAQLVPGRTLRIPELPGIPLLPR